MNPSPLTKTAFLAMLLSCAACTGLDESAPDYGYEMVPDPATAQAEAAGEASEGVAEPRRAPGVIRAGVRAQFPLLRDCYEAALQQAPALEGRVELRFQIQPDGEVTDVLSTDSSTIPDDEMIQCAIGAVQDAEFDPSEGGMVTVVYPILFSPGDE